VTPNSSPATTTLTVTTVGRSAYLIPPSTQRPGGLRPFFAMTTLACLLAMLWMLRGGGERKGMRRGLATAGLLVAAMSMAACGGGNNKQPSTPPGAVQVQVTASSTSGSGAVSHTTMLTLTVR
jgi:hypothetical protein